MRLGLTPWAGMGMVVAAHVIVLACMTHWHSMLSARSEYGTAGALNAVLSGLSQSLYQLFAPRIIPSNVLKFQVWGVVNGLWTRFWTEQLAESYSSPLPKLVWDQALSNPLCLLCFTGLSAFWEGRNVDEYLRQHYLKAFKVSLMIWPLASFLQFAMVPRKFVFLFNSVVSCIWNFVLAMVSR